MEQFVIVYRKHGELMNDTKIIGPFSSYSEADTFFSTLPAVGYYKEAEHHGRSGVKYIQEMITPLNARELQR